MRANGSNATLIMGTETTFNVLPTTPAGIQLPIISSALKGSQNVKDSKVIRNTRNPAPPLFGNKSVDGQIAVPVDVINFGYWLNAMFGMPQTTGAAAPYTHIYKLGNPMPSQFIQQGFTDIGAYELYTGCVASKLAMSFGGDDELQAKIDMMGCEEKLTAATNIATPTQEDFIEFANFEGSVLEGASSIAMVTGIDLSVDFSLDGESYCMGNQGKRRYITPGLATVSGTVNALFEDTVLLQKAINNTETSIDIKLTNGTNILEISLPEVAYTPNSPGIDGPKGISISLPFKAYYGNGVDKSAIVTTLTNSKPTY